MIRIPTLTCSSSAALHFSFGGLAALTFPNPLHASSEVMCLRHAKPLQPSLEPFVICYEAHT